MPWTDKEKKKDYAKRYNARPETRAHRKVYIKAYLAKNKDRWSEYHSKYQKLHPAKSTVAKISYRQRLRTLILEAYGHKCACCGETLREFLALDHINRDGKEHRAKYKDKGGNANTHIYEDVIVEGFPKDRYRLLCHNCNCARGFYGYCPHERADLKIVEGMAC